MNLPASIIIDWTIAHLSHTAAERRNEGLGGPAKLLCFSMNIGHARDLFVPNLLFHASFRRAKIEYQSGTSMRPYKLYALMGAELETPSFAVWMLLSFCT
ncbi:hypothetical protein [Rhizobium sp. BR 315]|uniref:hypothetical protein n=1 Tax=Rhizobium sp. BR 315 TaxID=3040014 RepID=UPI003D32C34E